MAEEFDPLLGVKQIPILGSIFSLGHMVYDTFAGNEGHFEGNALHSWYVSDGHKDLTPEPTPVVPVNPNPAPDQDQTQTLGGPQKVDLDSSNHVNTDQASTTSGQSHSSSAGESSAKEGSVSEVTSTSNNATQANTLEQASSASAPSSSIVEVQSNAAQQFEYAQSLAGNNVTLSPVITIDAADTYSPVANRTSDTGWLSVVAISAVALGVVYMMPRDVKGKYAKYAAKYAKSRTKVIK